NRTPDLAALQVLLLSRLADAHCQQKRFGEAESVLLEQKQELSALLSGRDPRCLVTLEKQLGEVLARSGNAREALPILMSVATDSLGTDQDCAAAAFFAFGSGDVASS